MIFIQPILTNFRGKPISGKLIQKKNSTSKKYLTNFGSKSHPNMKFKARNTDISEKFLDELSRICPTNFVNKG